MCGPGTFISCFCLGECAGSCLVLLVVVRRGVSGVELTGPTLQPDISLVSHFNQYLY